MLPEQIRARPKTPLLGDLIGRFIEGKKWSRCRFLIRLQSFGGLWIGNGSAQLWRPLRVLPFGLACALFPYAIG